MHRLRLPGLAILAVTLASVGALAVAPSSRADYGTGTQYQVEISANNVSGGNFWFWASLGPGQESDYQNTDCIHTSSFLGANGTEDAAHSSGSLNSWSDSGGVIAMIGVKVIGGLETANFYISDTPHSNSFTLVATGGVPILPQGVPLTWSGQGVQVQVAP
jgi:hypothetical protein